MKLKNIDYFGYFKKFLITLPFIALFVGVWAYVSVLTNSEYLDVLETTNFTFHLSFLLLKQNIIAISVYTIIMLAIVIALIKNGDENKYIITVIEVWLTAVFIFVYISFTMQIASFAAAIAAMLTISAVMFGVNMIFAYNDKRFYKEKLYFLLILFVSFLIRIFFFDSSISAFNLLVDTFAINFFFVIVLGLYFFLRSADIGIFSGFVIMILFPFVLVLFLGLVYAIFYSVAAIFSGFHLSGMFHDFFLGALVKLFNISLSNNFPVTFAGLLSLFLSILGLTFFIVSFEKKIYSEDDIDNDDNDKDIEDELKTAEKNPNSSNKIIFQKHDYLWAIIGAIVLIFFVYQMYFEIKNVTPQNLQTESQSLQFKARINLKNKVLALFSSDSITYIVTENKKKNKFELNKISQDNLFVGKQDFPKFNRMLPTLNKDTIAFIEVNDATQRIDFHFFDVKNGKLYLIKKYMFDDLNIIEGNIDMTSYKYKNKNFILYLWVNRFGILDFTGKIVYTGILEPLNTYTIYNYYHAISTKVKNDTLYVFSPGNKWFKINLKNYSVKKFNSLTEVFSPPCFDYEIDTVKDEIIPKYMITKDSAKFIAFNTDSEDHVYENLVTKDSTKIIDSISSFHFKFINKNSFIDKLGLYYVNRNNNLQQIDCDSAYIFRNDTIIAVDGGGYLTLYSGEDEIDLMMKVGKVKQIELKGNTVNSISKNYFYRATIEGKK